MRLSAPQPDAGGRRFATGLCLPPGDAALEALGFAVPAPAEATPVLTHLRELPARAVRGELVWFSFDALCETATAVPDYLALTERFDTLVLDGVPPLAEASADGRQRFANLVDVACDRDARLILIGSDPLTSLPDGQALTRDLDRTTKPARDAPAHEVSPATRAPGPGLRVDAPGPERHRGEAGTAPVAAVAGVDTNRGAGGQARRGPSPPLTVPESIEPPGSQTGEVGEGQRRRGDLESGCPSGPVGEQGSGGSHPDARTPAAADQAGGFGIVTEASGHPGTESRRQRVLREESGDAARRAEAKEKLHKAHEIHPVTVNAPGWSSLLIDDEDGAEAAHALVGRVGLLPGVVLAHGAVGQVQLVDDDGRASSATAIAGHVLLFL